jgi:hypothetical protein
MPGIALYNLPNPIELSRTIESGNANYYEEMYCDFELANSTKTKSRTNAKALSTVGINISIAGNNLTNEHRIKQYSLPSYYNKNLRILLTSFNKEIDRYKQHPNIQKIKKKFDEASLLLSELPFENASVEVSHLESIRFTLQFRGNKLLLVSQTMNSIEDLRENEVIFSFFVNKELLISNAATITTLVEGFQELLTL